MPCQCPDCTTTQAQTYTPTYAAECLSRWIDAKAKAIVAMPSRTRRQAALQALIEAKAPKLRERVEFRILELWGK